MCHVSDLDPMQHHCVHFFVTFFPHWTTQLYSSIIHAPLQQIVVLLCISCPRPPYLPIHSMYHCIRDGFMNILTIHTMRFKNNN